LANFKTKSFKQARRGGELSPPLLSNNTGCEMSIMIEKSRINLWTLGGLAMAVVVNSFGLGVLYNRMTNNDDYSKAQITFISNQLSILPDLQYAVKRANEKIDENRSNLEKTNKRTDEIVSSFAGKLDSMAININRVATQIEVLSTQFTEREKKK
jgi:peptidoglycan hydrolase CwlO-like protein